MFHKESKLSGSLEDYLEAIYNLSIQGKSARTKDIANSMRVTMPSVNGAVRSLATKGLVKHKPYESIALTPEGILRAKNIASRHAGVKLFLVDVLGIDADIAESEACGLEHAISEDTLERLVGFVREYRGESADMADESPVCESVPDSVASLDTLCPGTSGTILSISGNGKYRNRLLEMGLGPGAKFEVLRIAPLGDPIEIKVRGYLVSLRKTEAALISTRISY